jgi:tricorn protease
MARRPSASGKHALRFGASRSAALRGSTIALLLLAVGLAAAPAPVRGQDVGPAEARLLRFPALSKDSIAFVHGGDLWTVPRAGGVARQLTTDPGLEWLPRYSPDGKWIAFTGQYDGNRDVYVIPASGGEPKRLTWWADTGHPSERQGPNNMVIGWTPDSRRVLFRSRHLSWEDRAGRLFTVDLEGSMPEQVGVPEGGFASFSPDGRKIVYNRIFRDFRTWKRYRGGMTQNLWIYDLAANQMEKITENDNTSRDPMWIGDTIYFNSDRDKTFNLFSCDAHGKNVKKLTSFTDYDVRWASAGPGGVAFEKGGDIYLLDTASGRSSKVQIRVPSDMRTARTEFVNVGDQITDGGLSPEGKRVVLVARGEVFTVPAEKGNTRNLTNTSNAHERGAAWSPDGKWIAYLSDQTGEDEVWMISQDGKGAAQRLTTDGHGWRFPPVWSPDGKKLAFADKDLKLFVLDVASRKLTQADQAKYQEISGYAWSPDSRWLTYHKLNLQQLHQVYVYSLDSGKVTVLTSEMNDSYAPVFDPGGKYLYFLSDRDLNASIGSFDFSYVYDNPTRPYALTLRKELPSPFAPESDEVKSADKKDADEEPKEAESVERVKKDKSDKKEKDKDKKKAEPLRIDLEGIEDRIAAFPVPPGNYGALRANEAAVFYLSSPVPTLTGGPDGPSGDLHAFDMEKRKDAVVISEIGGFDLSPDGSKLAYLAGDKVGLLDTKPGTTGKVGDGAVSTAGMRAKIDHRAEWRQIFDEAWRLERDFFYVPNMHGVDWPAMKAKYGALVPYVAHRSDLTYLIGEMISELNIGHAYVGGGEAPKPRDVPIGLLGCDYQVDKSSGRTRISRILLGQNWIDARRSPLTEPGVVVAEGSYLLAIDGADLKAPQVPDDLLQGKAGGTVTLTLASKPSGEGSHEVTVKPLADEADLRYYDQIERNRRKVDAATQGKIAYVHIPNMGGDGLNEFVRQYYPQIRKQGLIVDARNNGGGFVSELIIERLRRVLAGLGTARNTENIGTYPSQVFYGPMVCLINHYSASDGDLFPYYFKKYGLGPLIGTRTWGGVTGIRGTTSLLDGGYVTRPEFGNYGLEGAWEIEGHGVDPDIEVDQRDDLVMQGKDPQLEKGIEVLMEQIRKNPKTLPPPPAPPVKN